MSQRAKTSRSTTKRSSRKRSGASSQKQSSSSERAEATGNSRSSRSSRKNVSERSSRKNASGDQSERNPRRSSRRSSREELEERLRSETVDQQAATEVETSPPGSRRRKKSRSQPKDSSKSSKKKRSANREPAAEKKPSRFWSRLDRIFTVGLILCLLLGVGWVYGVNVWSQKHGATALHPLSLQGLWARSQTMMAYLQETWGPPPKRAPSLGYEREIQAAALRYQIDTALLKAVIQAESQFRPLHVDTHGAMGLMQITPQIAKTHSRQKHWFRPSTNIMLGARFLQQQLRRYRQQSQALAAYHYRMRGLAIPRKYQEVTYIKRVNRALRKFRRDPGHQIRRASRHQKPRQPSRFRQMIRKWVRAVSN